MPETSNGIVPYQNARRAGRRYLSEHAKDKYQGYLPVLEQELEGVETMGEVSLGTHEIPLKKIVGTYAAGRADAFTANFMPLLDEGTEFASKWRALYGHHLRDGITDPIKVYEYIGQFYVVEGNKRVSVMNFVGAYSITADITRILPKYDENDEQIKIYYEIINRNPRSFAFGDMWFNHYGGFSALMWQAEEFAKKTPELAGKQPEEWVPKAYRDFAFQYSQAGFRDIDMTTAEALIIYNGVYDFPYDISSDELYRKIKNCEAQFRLANKASRGDVRAAMPITIEEGGSSSGSGRGILGIGTRRAKAVFVYGPPPDVSSWVRSHEAGRHDVENFFEGRVTTEAVYGVNAENAYNELTEIIAKHKPDILFTVDADFARASLQVSLENPRTLVFNCNHSTPNVRLNTYYLKMYEQFFILGAIAGSYTKSDIIGIVDTPIKGSRADFNTPTTYTLNAFVQGAKMVNHNIVVKRCTPRVNFSHDEDRLCRKLLAERGCDVVCCHYPTYGAVRLKPSDDLNAMLCSVQPNGRIKEYLAAPAMNWGVVYRRIVGDYLDGAFDHFTRDTSAPSLYFWLGLKYRAAKIYTVDAVLGSHTVRLARMLEHAVAQSHVHPFVGPIRDREGNMRIDRDKVPSLMEIQWMNWVCDLVDEEIEAK